MPVYGVDSAGLASPGPGMISTIVHELSHSFVNPVVERHRLQIQASADTVQATVADVVDLGAGAEFLPSRNGRGTLIGVRFGYVFAPSPTSWQMNHCAVSDGPAATIAGPYIRMVIGAGGWR